MPSDSLQFSASYLPQLQTRGVFCLYCEVEANGIRVAIPAIDYGRVEVGQVVRLVEPDGDRFFEVEVPALADDDYDVIFPFAEAVTLCLPQTSYLQAQNN